MTTKPDTTARRPLISRETVVPLGIVVAVIAVAVASAWRVSGALTQSTADDERRYERLETDSVHRFERLERRLDQLNTQLQTINIARFTREEMRMWVELLKAKNKTLEVPELPQ